LTHECRRKRTLIVEQSTVGSRQTEEFMSNVWTAISAALGMALLVGGIMGLIGGIFQRSAMRTVSGLGPFDGQWDSDNVKFLGAILASCGSAVLTFALLMRRKD
jgi:hypothetical protein